MSGNKLSDFYGSASQLAGGSGGVGSALEVPPEAQGSGNRPVHFWLGLVLALIVVRVAYEVAD
jgi:hypothetical protein